MTTPRIEELVEEFEHKIISVDELGHQAHIGDAYGAIQWLRQALTEAHQAGRDEVVEIVEQEKNKFPYGYKMIDKCADEKVGAYIQALDDLLTQLTNKDV